MKGSIKYPIFTSAYVLYLSKWTSAQTTATTVQYDGGNVLPFPPSLVQLTGGRYTEWPQLDLLAPVNIPDVQNLDFSSIPDIPVWDITLLGDPATCMNQTFADTCNWTCNGCHGPDDVVNLPVSQVWGVSFDDGPTNNTMEVLSYLDTIGVKITFCLVGSRVVQNPSIAQLQVTLGHQLCVHTYSHHPPTTMNNSQYAAEIIWGAYAIKAATGVTPAYARLPNGDGDNRIRAISALLGYKHLLWWSYDTQDWQLAMPSPTYQASWIPSNISSIIANKTAGPITLEHDLFIGPVTTGLQVLQLIHQSSYYTIAPIASGLGDGQWYRELGGFPIVGANGSFDASQIESYVAGHLMTNTSTAALIPYMQQINATNTTGSNSTTPKPTSQPPPQTSASTSAKAIIGVGAGTICIVAAGIIVLTMRNIVN